MKMLKKIIKFFRKLFKGIGKIIDKIIITPISKIALFFSENTNKSADRLEKWLNKKNTLIFISLFILKSIWTLFILCPCTILKDWYYFTIKCCGGNFKVTRTNHEINVNHGIINTNSFLFFVAHLRKAFDYIFKTMAKR